MKIGTRTHWSCRMTVGVTSQSCLLWLLCCSSRYCDNSSSRRMHSASFYNEWDVWCGKWRTVEISVQMTSWDVDMWLINPFHHPAPKIHWSRAGSHVHYRHILIYTTVTVQCAMMPVVHAQRTTVLPEGLYHSFECRSNRGVTGQHSRCIAKTVDAISIQTFCSVVAIDDYQL